MHILGNAMIFFVNGQFFLVKGIENFFFLAKNVPASFFIKTLISQKASILIALLVAIACLNPS